MVREIEIREQTIRLGQLLKLAGIVDSGSEVKALLGERPARVNGEPEARRGRQLSRGDAVQIGEHDLLVTGAPETVRPDLAAGADAAVCPDAETARPDADRTG
ncbi:MAG: RNA-binding S4 domain-containing protein [Solirubrobacterales bacterium]|nr:RNA-binding S4 domain-containing protein [Solirubrobacterales bacterium]